MLLGFFACGSDLLYLLFVISHINAELGMNFLNHHLSQRIIYVLPAKKCVTIDRSHSALFANDIKDRYVKCAATEVEDDTALQLGVCSINIFAKAKRCSSWLIDYSLAVEASDLSSIHRGRFLAVIEVCGYRNDTFCYFHCRKILSALLDSL